MFSFLFRGIAQIRSFVSHSRLGRAYQKGIEYVYQREMRSKFAMAEDVSFGNNMETSGEDCIEIKDGTCFGDFCILTAWKTYQGDTFSPQISIGSKCSFGEYNHITSINSIKIGNGVLTGRWVTITDNSHGGSDLESLAQPPIDRKHPVNPVFSS